MRTQLRWLKEVSCRLFSGTSSPMDTHRMNLVSGENNTFLNFPDTDGATGRRK